MGAIRLGINLEFVRHEDKNFDPGNRYQCGQDPYGWLASVLDRLVHLQEVMA